MLTNSKTRVHERRDAGTCAYPLKVTGAGITGPASPTKCVRAHLCALVRARACARARAEIAVPAIVVAAATPPIVTASTAVAPSAAPAPPPGAVIVIACPQLRVCTCHVQSRAHRLLRLPWSSRSRLLLLLPSCLVLRRRQSRSLLRRPPPVCGGVCRACATCARRGVCSILWSSFSPRLALRRLRSRLMLRCRLPSDERPRPPPVILQRGSNREDQVLSSEPVGLLGRT